MAQLPAKLRSRPSSRRSPALRLRHAAVRLERSLAEAGGRGRPGPARSRSGRRGAPACCSSRARCEPGRGRDAETPARIPWARLEGHPVAHLRGDFGGPAAADRRLASCSTRCSRSFPAITALVSVYGLFATASTISEHLELPRRRDAGRGLSTDQRAGRAHRGQQRRQADVRLRRRPRHCAVERECRHEGDLRRAQRRLRRGREAQLHQAQRGLAGLHARRHRVLLLAISAVVVLPLVLAYLGFAAERAGWVPAAAALAVRCSSS